MGLRTCSTNSRVATRTTPRRHEGSPLLGGEEDLIAIGDYIARDSPLRASTFVRELAKACAELSSTPLRYPIVRRYEARGVRRRVYENYQIFYRVIGQQVFVIRVLHGARDYDALL